MSSELALLRAKDLYKLAPLVKNAEAWEAFMFLLEHEEAKLMLALLGKPVVDELIRISGKFEFIKHLKNARQIFLDMEKDLAVNQR